MSFPEFIVRHDLYTKSRINNGSVSLTLQLCSQSSFEVLSIFDTLHRMPKHNTQEDTHTNLYKYRHVHTHTHRAHADSDTCGRRQLQRRWSVAGDGISVMFDTGLLWSPSCCLTTLMTNELLVLLRPKENIFISPTPTIPRIVFICVDLNRMHSLKIWRIGRKWTWVRTLWAAVCRGYSTKWSVWMLLHAFSLYQSVSVSHPHLFLSLLSLCFSIPLLLFLSPKRISFPADPMCMEDFTQGIDTLRFSRWTDPYFTSQKAGTWHFQSLISDSDLKNRRRSQI